ncbi:replication restart helicase PriA [Kiritimatiella glycovorans]|uniref:Replication restart protein PriA n=1 Tax=Kiritimatiella glycovorans TaxID=1307763 RepID=A0A0G3EE39_9BACT|nr:primosomal protein N' [Kiritimatiella glycovorans]AKJ63682.1 Primosomal protein N' [Kiritimatiella glycovorans]
MSESTSARYARVVTDLALDREFDYRIPPELKERVREGSLVRVPFGPRELRGWVTGLTDRAEVDPGKIRDLLEVEGDRPFLLPVVRRLARWMARYYCAPIETAFRTVLPGAVRREGARPRQQLTASIVENAAGEDGETITAKQERVLDILRESGPLTLTELTRRAGTSQAPVRSLAKKGRIELKYADLRRDPLARRPVLRVDPPELMPQQRDALERIREASDSGQPRVLLLHGVTGSGKTEVYLQAIRHVIDHGRSAIVLVPEIALTPQTVDRFRSRFGDRVAVLHSHLSDGERFDEWGRIRDGKADIVVGARSAVFAPLEKPGLIVVDEEHESSYKQEEAPRYHARDVAVVRGRMESCPVVLGSATPSLESLSNVRKGKYELLGMPSRVDDRTMPRIRVVDMRVEAEREGKPVVFSRLLIEEIRARLERAEQTILFLNRRGFSSSLICPQCGHVAQCDRCSVSMTYHKKDRRLKCHLCGAEVRVPERCPNADCRSPEFKYAGMGTERIEEILGRLLKGARIRRVDSDTMRGKESYDEVLGDFRTGKLDLLVGTQMLAKGLDFPNVTLVGVINADISLHMPDFRAGERTFQLLTQVAGRAGRGEVEGEVVVQTFTPYETSIQAARRMAWEEYCDQELEFRRELSYPPHSHLVCIHFEGPGEATVHEAADRFAQELVRRLPETVILSGPAPAPLARIKGQYRYHLLLRAEKTASMTRPLKELMSDYRFPRGISCRVDVDAQSLL